MISPHAPCPLPFTNLALMPDGSVLPCCLRSDYVLGSVDEIGSSKQTFEEFWNSEKLQKLRLGHLSNTPHGCTELMQSQQCHRWYEHLRAHVQFDSIQKQAPKRLDIRLSNECNLKCRMCIYWRGKSYNYTQSQFWDFAQKDLFKDLEEVDVLGGEPFIQNETWQLIELISKLSPHCIWNFTTNGNWEWSEFITEKLKSIRLRRIVYSIDSLDEQRYRNIRKNGSLTQALKNLDNCIRFRNNRADKSMDIYLHYLIQTDNWSEAPSVIEFCKNKNITADLWLLNHPLKYSLFSLHGQARELIALFFEETLKNHPSQKLEICLNQLKNSLKT